MTSTIDHIRDTADALTEPHQHAETYHTWTGSRHKQLRRHITTQPGLLTQLYQAVPPANTPDDDTGHSIPGSRPPLALEALSRHVVITAAVTRWCWSLRIDIRDNVESNIRALVGHAPNLDNDTAHALLAEMRQWQRWCSVLTGWERIYQPAAVPCPIDGCGKTNTLRVNLTTKTAMCRDCGSAWAEDDGSIFILADYIRTTSEAAA